MKYREFANEKSVAETVLACWYATIIGEWVFAVINSWDPQGPYTHWCPLSELTPEAVERPTLAEEKTMFERTYHDVKQQALETGMTEVSKGHFVRFNTPPAAVEPVRELEVAERDGVQAQESNLLWTVRDIERRERRLKLDTADLFLDVAMGRADLP